MAKATGSDSSSRRFLGSAMLPPMTLTDDDAHEYRSIAAESFRETSALYEDFLYQQNRTLDTRRWKLVRSKDNVQVYRQRSGSNDAGMTTTASAASLAASQGPVSGPPTSLTSSPGPLEDDTLFIGPGSSLSVASKIPVLVSTGTVQGTLDDVMYGVFTNDTASLRRRAIYGKDRVDDVAMLGALETPTHAAPFDFLGVAWMLYPGLGALVKQRDYVVLLRTGIATTSRGERIGYGISQSVSHRDLPPLQHLDVLRGSMSFCVLYRQLDDQLVESFMHTVVDPGGAALTFFVLQEIAASTMGLAAPIECAHGKKLRWYLQKTAARQADASGASASFSSSSSSSSAATEPNHPSSHQHKPQELSVRGESAPSSCSYCHKSIGKLFSQSAQCPICREQWVCRHCSVSKSLVVRSSRHKVGMTTHAYAFCLGCFLTAKNRSAVDIQRDEVLPKRSLAASR
ncbi:hypothetical protein BBJ28_00015083 [Nothophytophthora sp. Chile5]|nr:hypothetical protein BBJ28_00015083 [Nothophytophthora sp. Chile5]